jgi:hypothetical protein
MLHQKAACTSPRPRTMTARVGPPAEIKRADGPRRAIEIVALAGQLCATIGEVLIVTARATQKVPAPFQTDEKSADSLASGQFELLDDRLIKLRLPSQQVPVGRQIEPFGLDVSVGSQFGAPQAFVPCLRRLAIVSFMGQFNLKLETQNARRPGRPQFRSTTASKSDPRKPRGLRVGRNRPRISNQASATSGIT